MQPIKVHELALPTCVLFLSKNFDPSSFLNVAPSLSMSMSKQLLPQSFYIFHIFVPISPPLSSISIKRYDSFLYKGLHLGVDGCNLNLVFLWTPPHMLGMTPLVALEIPHVGSLTLIPIGRAPPPMS